MSQLEASVTLLEKWKLFLLINADPELSSSAKLAAFVFLDCYNSFDGRCFPKVVTVAERMGRSERSVSGYIAELKQRGWITHQRRRRGSSVYNFAFDRIADDPQKAADKYRTTGDEAQERALRKLDEIRRKLQL